MRWDAGWMLRSGSTIMMWRDYHEFTKHSVASLRRVQHVLDWANMPDPFRHYEGAPVLDLPAGPPAPEKPALDVLRGVWGTTSVESGPAFLSQLLFYAAAVSASKLVPSAGYKYALRVNPSSGNVHPTEFHFVARGLKDWPDGLYHYRPSAHMAEQRAIGDVEWNGASSSAPLVFVLTSIAWREEWKYRDRAYRYCLLDIGHAWQALALAAQAIGCEAVAVGEFADDEISESGRLPEDEWPMLVVELRGTTIPVRERDAVESSWTEGVPNRLSQEVVAYPRIEGMHRATKLASPIRPVSTEEPAQTDSGRITLPSPESSTRCFGAVARSRRSALDFQGGARPITQAQLSAILVATCTPLAADFARTSFIQLYIYVHRVDDLEPGVYRVWPERMELEPIRLGDQRVAAAGLSLGQDLAGNACVAFSMIGDLERAARTYGDRGYRYVYFEAGAIGHRLYLAAEALGLGGTGIGAFYDEEVRRYLDLTVADGQPVYHFAIGYPVTDSRLSA